MKQTWHLLLWCLSVYVLSPSCSPSGGSPLSLAVRCQMQRLLTSFVHVPEQALVEQCAAAGRVGDVERCVLRLDLATLDFNQVPNPSRALLRHTRSDDIFESSAASTPLFRPTSILPLKFERCVAAPTQVTRLCRAHHLHSALAFLFTRALSDYTAPAAELLLAHAHAPPEGPHNELQDAQAEWGMKAKTGYKLLVFLRCGLSGEAFPPG
jgi:hypothetical protein